MSINPTEHPGGAEPNWRTRVLNEVHEKFRQERDQQIARITELADKVTVPDVESLQIPFWQIRTQWTEAERDAVFKAVTEIFGGFGVDPKTLTARGRLSLCLKMITGAQKRVLPAKRHRDFPGWGSIPKPDHSRYETLFSIEHATELAIHYEITAPKTVTWTPQEEHRILVHLCHLMRKQGIRHIPDPSDHGGSIMFADYIREAQARACARHRRRDLSHARAALMDAGLMPKLEPMLRLPQLPPVPEPPMEMEQIMAQPLDKVETNGHAPAAVEPAPDKFAGLSDAEIFQAALGRALGMAGKLEAMEREIKQTKDEAASLAGVVAEENSLLNKRIADLSNQVTELNQRITASSLDAAQHKVPVVAILGCRKDQFDEVTKKATDSGMNLKFKHFEQQQSKIVPVYGCDYAIMMPGMPHKQSDMVTQTINRGQYVFLNHFSVTRAVAQLQVWFQPEVAAVL